MKRNKLKNLYNSWHENNRSKIINGQWDLVNKRLLESPETDSLRGLNLITYLPDNINQIIDKKLLPKLNPLVSPSGWTVPPEGRHITILDMIPHNSGISTKDQRAHTEKYNKIIDSVYSSFEEEVRVELDGIFTSPDGITIQGFPVGDGLHKLREALRNSLKALGLINLEKKKYIIETAHVALIKFVKPLDGKQLLKTVDSLRNFPIGMFSINQAVLTISTRHDKIKTMEVINKFNT